MDTNEALDWADVREADMRDDDDPTRDIMTIVRLAAEVRRLREKLGRLRHAVTGVIVAASGEEAFRALEDAFEASK